MGEILSWIRNKSALLELGEEDIDRLHVICDEFISNIIKNAYCMDDLNTWTLDGILYEKPLMVVCRKTLGCVRVELTDWGRPFNPLGYSGDEDHGKKEGGHGIFIAVHLADDIAYLRKSGMNIVTVYIHTR